MKYLLVLMLIASPASAQFLDPDRRVTSPDKVEHFVAGAALNIVVSGPWITKSFRNTAWKRCGLVAVIGAAYEGIQWYEAKQAGNLGKEGYGFGLLDLGADVAGCLAIEGVRSVLSRR